MATVKRKKSGNFLLNLDKDEIDVVYRLLKSTKRNEEKTRLDVVNDILDVVDVAYARDLTFDENERLSQDFFGEVCFTHDARYLQ